MSCFIKLIFHSTVNSTPLLVVLPDQTAHNHNDTLQSLSVNLSFLGMLQYQTSEQISKEGGLATGLLLVSLCEIISYEPSQQGKVAVQQLGLQWLTQSVLNKISEMHCHSPWNEWVHSKLSLRLRLCGWQWNEAQRTVSEETHTHGCAALTLRPLCCPLFSSEALTQRGVREHVGHTKRLCPHLWASWLHDCH